VVVPTRIRRIGAEHGMASVECQPPSAIAVVNPSATMDAFADCS
jgi:hypothetical protein